MKVLLVEDDAPTRNHLATRLRLLGHTTIATASGREAWGLYKHEHSPMVVSDWMMPEMDGIELTRHKPEMERHRRHR